MSRPRRDPRPGGRVPASGEGLKAICVGTTRRLEAAPAPDRLTLNRGSLFALLSMTSVALYPPAALATGENLTATRAVCPALITVGTGPGSAKSLPSGPSMRVALIV